MTDRLSPGILVGSSQLVGSPWVGFGSALTLNGKTDCVNLGVGATSIASGGPFTLEAKVKLTALGVWQVVFARYDGNAFAKQNFFLMVMPDGRLHFLMRTGGSSFIGVDGPIVSTGVPYSLAVVYDSNRNINVFANGTKGFIDNCATALPDFNIPIFLGAIGGNSLFLNGIMDEVRFSNVARYATNQNYTPSATPFVDDANTIYLCHFDTIDRIVR